MTSRFSTTSGNHTPFTRIMHNGCICFHKQLRYWLFVQLQSTCWTVGKKWEISPSSPTLRQHIKPSTQLIQTRWSKTCTPPLPSWHLCLQYPSSGCLLMWDWQETKKQTDLQKSAVRLRRHRILSPREAKTLLHSRYNGDWKKYNGGYQAHHDPIWRLQRAQQTTIFRLRTGHCGLSAHLKRIGISDTSLCECGQADQTPDHILQSCPKYAERRQLTWLQGADLATKLWGSAENLYQTAGFVASTGLKIWPAQLSIAEEEEVFINNC